MKKKERNRESVRQSRELLAAAATVAVVASSLDAFKGPGPIRTRGFYPSPTERKKKKEKEKNVGAARRVGHFEFTLQIRSSSSSERV